MMLEFIGILIIVFCFSAIALTIYKAIKVRRKLLLPTELINQEMFVEQEQVITVLPKRAVADSHWHVKTFMRPRRKRV